MATTIPTLPVYTGKTPVIGQTQPEFNTNRADKLAYDAQLFGEEGVSGAMNDTIQAMNTVSTEVETNAVIAEASATSAEQAAAALGYKGEWTLSTDVEAGGIYGCQGSEWRSLTGVSGVAPVEGNDWRNLASAAYVTESQGELVGGSVFPESGVLATGMNVTAGTTHVRVLGGDFSSAFLMKLYRVGEVNAPASGSVSSINLTIKPYTTAIGGVTYYLTDPSQEEGHQNILSFFAVNDGNLLLNTGTNNRPMIQACLDTCAWNGGSPYVPTGVFKFLGSLTARKSKVNTFVESGNDMLWRGDSMFLSTLFGEGQDLIDLNETKRFLGEKLMIAGKGSLGTNGLGYSNLPTGRCFFSSQVDQANFSAIVRLTQVAVARCDEVLDAPRGTWLSYINECDFRFCNKAPSLDRGYASVITSNNYLCQRVIDTQAALVRTDFSNNHISLGTWSAIFGLPEYTYDMAIGSLDFTKNYHETYSRMGVGSVVFDLRIQYGDNSKFTSNYFSIGQTSLDDIEAFRRFDGISGGLSQVDANTVFSGNVYTNDNLRDKAFSVVDGSSFNIDILDDDLYCKTFADQIVGKTVIARNNFKFRMVMDITTDTLGNIDLPIVTEFTSGGNGENYTPDYRIMNSDGTLNMGLIGGYKFTVSNVRNQTIPAGKELYLQANSVISQSRTLLSNSSAYSDKNGVSVQRASFVTPITLSVLTNATTVDYNQVIPTFIELEYLNDRK